jgi:hypothetical protein
MGSQATDRAGVEWRWRLAALVLGSIVLSIGCSPFMLVPFLWPEGKTPPPCPLADSAKKESAIVVMASFTTLPDRPEIMNADQQLAEILIEALQKRFAEEKLKVKIIPHYMVQNYQNKTEFPETPYDVGKHFQVDKVVSLEVGNLSLYQKGGRQLFLGRAEITVVATDIHQPRETSRIWQKEYITTWPRTGEIMADDGNPAQFRGGFLDHIAKDMTRYFIPYTAEQRVGVEKADSEP